MLHFRNFNDILRKTLVRRNIMRTKFTLRCTECKMENYHTNKNKKLHPERLETKKFCPKCGKQTLHKEKK